MNAGKKFVAMFFLGVLFLGVLSAAGGTYLYFNWEKHFPPMALFGVSEQVDPNAHVELVCIAVIAS